MQRGSCILLKRYYYRHYGRGILLSWTIHLDGRLIESKKASVLYLPAYSPDLNPMELSFSKLKSVLRKEKIRDVSTLQQFLLESRHPFKKKECRDYFKHDGYCVEKR